MSSLQKSLLHGSLVSSQASVVDSVLLGVLCRIIMAMLSAFGGEAVCTAVVMSAVGGAPALQVPGLEPNCLVGCIYSPPRARFRKHELRP